MLAKRGKVRGGTAYSDCCLTGLGSGKGKYTKSEWDKEFDFWVYIQDELRRQSAEARLIFRTGYTGTSDPRVAYDVDDVDIFRYQYGYLTWLPLTYFDDNLQYVTAVRR